MNDLNETGPFQPSPVEEAAAAIPRNIGRYRLEKVLGRGGFGLVYLAHDGQLQRLVAIKVPHRHLVTRPEDAQSYLSEARIVANLDHPNIVTVHDVGSDEEFPVFIVSKYIEGTTLAKRIKDNRPSLTEMVELIATVAETLHYAHRKGLVHRDVKPGNILLDASGKPFVADFGLALREQDIGTGPRYAGTPAYMSPEQARGEGHRVDGRSDIFSLGVVLYETLTGRRPFHADAREELLEQIANREVRPPRQWDDAIPKELERICLKALSKRASDRYTTAKDMADDLRYWLRPLNEGRHPDEVGTGPAEHVSEAELAAEPGLSKHVFISYASPDQEAAYRLCRLLEEQAIGCWIAPRDVAPGGDYGVAIIRAIEGTAATVLLLSSHANTSIHVTHEVERATSKRKRVISVRLEDVKPSPSLELHLATAQWVDAWRFPPQQVAERLATVLRGEGVATLCSPATTPPITPYSDQQPIKIVPKGLRSFDQHDADFFLELLPGPRDRDGLPDSIRFWKSRIEEMDPDNTFSVGLIYGPSGCGKSSLVKAGLLPRLANSVTAVYVEATADETEARLLKGLRRQVTNLPGHLGLVESLAALRQGRSLQSGQKVLLVLDQFEQWLHAKRNEENTELVQALRQCDGGRVQCIVMVRDDFWMAVTRLMQALEVEPLPGKNTATVDLFDVRHAKRVLTAFGRAFGALPDTLTKEQVSFLDHAMSGLSQENKVISVWLALFAEMMKGKPWIPATLKEVGGTEGIGVTFLEETFSSSTANPRHRLHQKAARVVLKTLLPESGTEIKGHMRSHAELMAASGYANRPRDFDDLLRILDSEIRLITPTDPEGKDDAAPVTVQAGGKYYQLTHDYLVHSLRDWLTRKQKETRRGRAELLLADRAAVWNTRPENRQLPSLLQWVQIRCLTSKTNWTPPQRRMMRRTTQLHVVRGVAVVLLLGLLGLAGWEGFGRLKSQQLRDRLLESTTTDAPKIIDEMGPYRRWANPLLREASAQAEKDNDRRKHLHASLALLPVDANQFDFLTERLLHGDPDEVLVIRQALLEHQHNRTDGFWELLKNPANDHDQRFRAACALAAFAPDDPRWDQFRDAVAGMLAAQKPFEMARWTEVLKPMRKVLLPALAAFLEDEKRSPAERGLIANIYGNYAADVPEAYDRLEKRLADDSAPDASAEKRLEVTKTQANLAVGLLVIDRGEKVWPLLKHSPDPTLRSYLIERLGPGGVDARILLKRLDKEKDDSIRRALLLSLGEYGLDRLPPAERQNLLPRMVELYRHDPDPGIHGAARWLLKKWEAAEKIKEVDEASRVASAPGVKRGWYVNSQGQTMVITPKPREGVFWMGEGIVRHQQPIGHNFALSSEDVTVEQFQRFRAEYKPVKQWAPTKECPAIKVSWYDAAAYCNWLSKREGIAEAQWCYEINQGAVPALAASTVGLLGSPLGPRPLLAAALVFPDRTDEDGLHGNQTKIKAGYLGLKGYRLPTEAEWEYACRAGSTVGFSFGEPAELLLKYGWFDRNSMAQTHPCGALRPNDLGLFDMHGNVWQWTHDIYDAKLGGKEDDGGELVSRASRRVCRGGCWVFDAGYCRAAHRGWSTPVVRDSHLGFRPARVPVEGK